MPLYSKHLTLASYAHARKSNYKDYLSGRRKVIESGEKGADHGTLMGFESEGIWNEIASKIADLGPGCFSFRALVSFFSKIKRSVKLDFSSLDLSKNQIKKSLLWRRNAQFRGCRDLRTFKFPGHLWAANVWEKIGTLAFNWVVSRYEEYCLRRFWKLKNSSNSIL